MHKPTICQYFTINRYIWYLYRTYILQLIYIEHIYGYINQLIYQYQVTMGIDGY